MVPPGRQRWMDCVNRDMRAIGTTNDEVRDRTGWRRIVSAVATPRLDESGQKNNSQLRKCEETRPTLEIVQALGAEYSHNCSVYDKRMKVGSYILEVILFTFRYGGNSKIVFHSNCCQATLWQLFNSIKIKYLHIVFRCLSSVLKAKLQSIYIDTHQLHYIPLHHFII